MRFLGTTSLTPLTRPPSPAVSSTAGPRPELRLKQPLSLRLPHWRDTLSRAGLEVTDAELAAMVGNWQHESAARRPRNR